MPTKDIYYTSSNISSLQGNVIDNLKPNHKYTFTFPNSGSENPRHMKSGTHESGLVHTGVVVPPASREYIAPSDNVNVDIELVRSGNHIEANLLDFTYQNYNSYVYNFNVKAYSNDGLTSQTGSVSFDNTTVPVTRTMNNLVNTVNYFRVQDFYNRTAGAHVYASRTAKENNEQLSFRLYDVRGLAYMRTPNFATSTQPPDINNWFHSNPLSYEVRLSAEGKRLLIVYGSYSRCYAYTYVRRSTDSEWVPVHANTSLGERSRLYRYSTYSANGRSVYNFFASALTEYGDRYAVSNGNLLKFYDFETGTEIATAITFPGQIHCVNFTGDGTQILVSGNKANSTNTLLSYDTPGGNVKIYDASDGSELADLSSNQITSFDNRLYYGSDSAISGDGNTVVVFASLNTNINSETKAFIWKLNVFSDAWENVAILDFPGDHRHRTPCAVSHDGKVIVVCGSWSDALIYHTTDYITWASANIPGNDNFNSCDVSGDGRTVLFSYYSDTGALHNFRLYYNSSYPSSGTWTLTESTDVGYDGTHLSCALSYDGSTVCVHSLNKAYTVRYDKNGSIDSVYDYFGMKSSFYNYNYSFDYDTIGSPNWSGSNTKLSIHDIDTVNETAYYGYWDSTSISADGRFVLVGAPMENKVYLYDTNLNEVSYIFPPTESTVSSYFGVRCAMDDLAKWVVVVAHTNMYFYERSVEGFTQKGTATAHGYNSEIFQFKMSKDGSTALLTRNLDSTEIKKWDLSDWTWTDVPSSTTLSSGTKKVSAIDLSHDGQYIVAGQRVDARTGDLTVFYQGGNQTTTVSFDTDRYMHSVAISSVPNTSGEYTIITGDANPYTSSLTFAHFHIFKFHNTNKTLSSGISDWVSSPSIARYGRIATMSYDGTLALLSGNNEQDENVYHKGGAVLIDTSTRYKIKSFYHEPTGTDIKSEDNVLNSLGKKFNGFGSSCRISSDNKHILIGGGGYAFKYSVN